MSQFIGRRIVPVHGGVWDRTKSYEELTIVLHEASGDSYISRRPVPAGTVIGDTTYWMMYSLYSAQIHEAEQHLNEATEDVRNRISASEQKVSSALSATEKKVADELAATESAVERRASAAEQVTNTNKSELNSRMDGIDKRLDANVAASTDKDADYAAEVVDARVDDDETTYPSLGAHMRALGRGEGIREINANKALLPDTTLAKIYSLISQRAKENFESSYDPQTDTLRLACVSDYPGDYILYVPLMSPKDYASLCKLGNKLLIRYKATNVVNDSGSFKFGMWLGKRNHPDEIGGGIFGSTYIHTFVNGSEEFQKAVNIAVPSSLVYDGDQECYLKDEKPVTIQLLLYANSPKVGEEITLSGFGGLIVGLGRNSLVSAFGENMIRADMLTMSKRMEDDESKAAKRDEVIAANSRNDHMDAQIKDFAPEGVFAPSHSTYEKVEDEYGDQSYKMTYVDNNPMYQMRLDGFLSDSSREVIVEVTARRLSEAGKLRVQLYDSSCGLNHVPGPMTFALTSDYRRYQFRMGRLNSGNTTLGIGPDRTEGNTVQFKNVKVIIPNEQSKQVPVPLRYFLGYPDEVDFSEMEAVYLDNPLIVGTDDLAAKDGLYLDTIELYSSKQTSVAFYVGCIDQYGLFQEVSRHSVTVRVGRNLIKFDDRHIPVPYGNGIFVRWRADMAVYGTDLAWGYKNLVSTKANYYDKDGYSGYPLTESKYMIPMRYTLMEESLPVKLESFRTNLTKCNEQGKNLESRVQTIENSIQSGKTWMNVAMVSPDGQKYYLSVDANGGITTIRSIPKKVAVFGNSLTLGFGTFGMAASDSRHDYFHYVREYLLKMNPDLEMTRYGASTWEGMTDSASRKEAVNGFIRNLSGKEDLLIIQLSDNVNTAGKKETFPEDTWTMLSMFRSACPQARILWVASWYGWGANYGPIENACDELGIDLVDIRDLSQVAENQSKIGSTYTDDSGTVHEITSAGVASHPGDIGMKRIADRIIDCIEQYL